MYIEVMHEARVRYEEMLKQAEQERRVRQLQVHRPSLFQRSWAQIRTVLGHQMVQWGTALESPHRSTPIPEPVKKIRI